MVVGMAFLPRKYENLAFALLLSGIQTFIISGISTALAVGWSAELVSFWVRAYFSSWVIAFPSVLVVAPLVRRILKKIMLEPVR